jgi:hypothetical protein
LAEQHLRLPELRHDLFRCVPSSAPSQPPLRCRRITLPADRFYGGRSPASQS